MTKVKVSKTNTCTGHRDCVYALAGASNQYFYSSGGDGMVVRWNLDDPDKGDLLAQVTSSVYALKYIERSDILVVGQNFEGLQLVNVSERQIVESLKTGDAAIFCIEHYQNNLIVGLKSGMVLIVGTDPIIPVKKLNYSSESARVIAICEQTGEFAVGYSDNYIRIFDLDQFSLKKEIKAHENSVFALQYAADGNVLLSGSRDAHLKIWSTSDYSLQEAIVAHMYAINNVAFSPNGKHFVTCSMDKSIKVWDYSSFNLLKVIDKSRHAGHGTSVNKLFWAPYNDQLISSSDDRTISLWDLEFS